MRQHVARAQQIEDLRHQRAIGHTADVAHHARRHAGPLARSDGSLERLQAMAGDHVLAHSHLHPEHDVGVFGHRARRQIDLRVIDVVELGHRKSGQAGDGDVHKRELARARPRHHEAPQPGQVVGAGVARGHHRGRALLRRQFVGRYADRRSERIGMRMQVDEAGRHQLAAGVHHALATFRSNRRLDRFDHAVADADIAFA